VVIIIKFSNGKYKQEMLTTLSILTLMFISFNTLTILEEKAELFNLSYALFIVIKNLVPIFFGLLLGLPYYCKTRAYKLGYNWAKLIIQGLPALIIMLPSLLMATLVVLTVTLDITSLPINWKYFPWFSNPADAEILNTIAGVWFGKTIIGCSKSNHIEGEPIC